jgi:hypothetical protein
MEPDKPQQPMKAKCKSWLHIFAYVELKAANY